MTAPEIENDVPRNNRGLRQKEHVKPVMLRMGDVFIDQLDKLCQANNRSRREIVEILVSEAYLELAEDPAARITPL